MSIDEFTAVLGAGPTRERLNEIVTAVNALVAATAPTYSKVLSLWPEYPGMAWYAAAASYGYGYQAESLPNVHHAEAGGRNWYEWSSATGSVETVRAALKWTTPQQFVAWSTSALTFGLWANAIDDTASVAMNVYRNTTLVETVAAKHPVAASTWEDTVLTSTAIQGGSWVAGDELTVEFVFSAESTSVIRLAETELRFTETG